MIQQDKDFLVGNLSLAK